MTTILYTKIRLLPQCVQDTIWSFNVEGHIEKTKILLEEFNSDCTLSCAGCLKKVHIKDCFCGFSRGYSFSAEYYFYLITKREPYRYNHYGIECGDSDCNGMRTKRYNCINYDRKDYYRNWRYRLDIYDKNDEEEDDEEYAYYYY